MLLDNRRILQVRNKALLEKLTDYESSRCEVIASRASVPTLMVTKEGQSISYHSRYNPEQEAEKFIESQLDEQTEYVLLIGIGLGYALKSLKNNYPKVKFSIFEPDLDVMNCFLQHFDLSKVNSKNIDYIFSDVSELFNVINLYENLKDKNAKLVIHPVAERLCSKSIEQFNNGLKDYIRSQKQGMLTDLKFQLRWIENSIVNFNEVLSTPNIFKHIDQSNLQKKPVIIVAAGPSLDLEIENLRTIKEQGTAYIFAVGSAVNTLIRHNIYPDALFSYDPQRFNKAVVEKIKELNLNIPLVFGSSVGYETIQNYPGPKAHFITSQDTISPHFIDGINENIVSDAPTIAAITLQIVAMLGMGPILLVGQNLSITKEKTYASGIDYYAEKVNTNEEILKTHRPIISTTNEEVYTNDSYVSMRNAIQMVIAQNGLKNQVINTTVNGAPIEGTLFLPLQEAMLKILGEEKIVDTDLFDKENNYDKVQAIKQFWRLEDAFNSLIKDFKKAIEFDNKLKNAYQHKIITNVQSLFAEYDKYFQRIEANEFFKLIVRPITRVQYKDLLNSAKKLRNEKRPLVKLKIYCESHSKYIPLIYLAINQIQPAFGEIKQAELFKNKG